MSQEHKIKLLVVESSEVVRTSLVRLLNSDPRLHVIGVAENGSDALQFIARKTPDLILMDIHMPVMDGLETTRRIMEIRPVPIVICSGNTSGDDAITTFRSLEAGAVACVSLPSGGDPVNDAVLAAQLVQTVKLMSEVKVVHRWPRSRRAEPGNVVGAPLLPKPSPLKINLIGIGASTGGPPVLQAILAGLPKDFPAPLLAVQHIARGFLAGLVEWLGKTTGARVHIAAHGIVPQPGHVYLAPDDFHMAIDAKGCIALSDGEPDNGLRPSVDHLFQSLADFCGSSAVGVLLTGMGKDGARELKRMRENGATTLVQDRQTSVVHGMPGEAIAIGAADCVLPADKIAPALVALMNQQPFPHGGLS